MNAAVLDLEAEQRGQRVAARQHERRLGGRGPGGGDGLDHQGVGVRVVVESLQVAPAARAVLHGGEPRQRVELGLTPSAASAVVAMAVLFVSTPEKVTVLPAVQASATRR